ncbi:3-oxoacyl-[acyl-carrier-protein] synthase-3 [Litorimonas taeanensis]|uniref:3-oxoacyl-[acyl-carrier-protein] synthase-3 n=1 Tax=Litorimonas taeanensis TaxID=568099 RepID=A0A420WMU3_9PROT|nr:ketoacyl-ACP synthase III [Litorimonas taeanensis]RKQ72205.1 3-oxoacyl-[acyl-carrier-protein] synthase-3 [Litorimonas taeanensis]
MARISHIETFFPETCIQNKDLEGIVEGFDAEKISKKIGIEKRYIVSKGQTALDLAEGACKKLLEKVDSQSIDCLLLCTQSPEYFLPTTATILQHRLGLSTKCPALDFNLGCSGYIYGLSLAKGMIASGQAKKVLLVTSETYSVHLAQDDVSNRSIFGDGATATLVEDTPTDNLGQFSMGTDGSGAENLIVRNGATKNPIRDGSADDYLYMNGPEIFNFTIQAVPDLVDEVLEKNSLTTETVDYTIFHQANEYMLKYLRKKCRIPTDKFHIGMKDYGNTVSSTIPIALKQALDSKKLQDGNQVLLIGFGVGYSYGGTVITV